VKRCSSGFFRLVLPIEIGVSRETDAVVFQSVSVLFPPEDDAAIVSVAGESHTLPSST
jgi:hypothetical protein